MAHACCCVGQPDCTDLRRDGAMLGSNMAAYYTSQGYDAPAALIWSILTDFPSWPNWFPNCSTIRFERFVWVDAWYLYLILKWTWWHTPWLRYRELKRITPKIEPEIGTSHISFGDALKLADFF